MNRIKAITSVATIFSLVVLVSFPAFADDSVAALYKGKCSACHGENGSGDTTMGKKLEIPDLRGADVQKLKDSELHQIIAAGKGKMPAYGKKLSEEQISSLVSLIREMGKKK